MRLLLQILGVLLLLLVFTGAGVLWWLQDPNRFKARVETLARETADYDLSIEGELRWQLWPPLMLKGERLRIRDDSSDYELGAFAVRVNLPALLTGGELELSQLRLDELLVTDRVHGGRTRVDSLRLDTVSPAVPSPFSVDLTLERDDGSSSWLQVEGPLTFFVGKGADEHRLTLAPMRFSYDGIEGVCDATASPSARQAAMKGEPGRDELLPLALVRAVDWSLSCVVPDLAAGELTLGRLKVTSNNTAARLANRIELPDVLGGKVVTKVAIDAQQRPPRWIVTIDADDLQSQALMDLVAPSLRWAALLRADGEFNLRGNTMQALVNSATGQLAFESIAGQVDIGVVKDAVLGLAQLIGKEERVERWARELEYRQLAGRWEVAGTQQKMSVTIDNLELAARGTVNALSGAMDVRATAVINEDPDVELLRVSDALYGLPIPLRCKGSLEAPNCGLDASAAQRLLAAYAAGRADSEVSGRLDRLLREKVPEQYRDAAKSLLKGLFGGDRARPGGG